MKIKKNYFLFFIILTVILFILVYYIANHSCTPIWGFCKEGVPNCPPQSVIDSHNKCLVLTMLISIIPVLFISFLLLGLYYKIKKK